MAGQISRRGREGGMEGNSAPCTRPTSMPFLLFRVFFCFFLFAGPCFRNGCITANPVATSPKKKERKRDEEKGTIPHLTSFFIHWIFLTMAPSSFLLRPVGRKGRAFEWRAQICQNEAASWPGEWRRRNGS